VVLESEVPERGEPDGGVFTGLVSVSRGFLSRNSTKKYKNLMALIKECVSTVF